jgi:hypothetical protein
MINLATTSNTDETTNAKSSSPISSSYFISAKGNQGDLLTTLLACMGVPLDRPIGISTKQIKEIMNENLLRKGTFIDAATMG